MMYASFTIALATLAVAAFIITLSTMTPMAYAGGDINKQKTEDKSAEGIADCDKNYVTHAGFKCIPIAIGEVVEPPTILQVCKESN